MEGRTGELHDRTARLQQVLLVAVLLVATVEAWTASFQRNQIPLKYSNRRRIKAPNAASHGLIAVSKLRGVRTVARSRSEDITDAGNAAEPSKKDSIASTTKKGSNPKKTRATKKKKTKKTKEKDPPFWSDPSDQVSMDYKVPATGDALLCCQKVRFKVRGNPLPLRRHRTNRGFIYNPSANAQDCFRKIVENLIFHSNNQTVTNLKTLTSDLPTNPRPLFSRANSSLAKEESLAMTLLFRTKRPLSHFVASTRGRALKASAPSVCTPTRTDVDNLAKFVLDSLNELLYEDDHQISSLCVTKLLDDEESCLGSTEIAISVVSPDNINDITEKSFGLYEV